MTEEFIERRKTDQMQVILQLVQQIHDNQIAMDAKLTKHMTEETKELAEAIKKLMDDSFPDGDPSGHRRAHEVRIKREEERAEFWKKMRLELGKWGLLGLVGWLVVVAWQAFLQGPHK